ncbi:MAG TPA: efflux RND transporter periplasmic adaptor subunit, partial [Planctomycetota bacterium]|nr:efflux RND transporter periplasmic adaptor subunit [Planctomycetota bacterium]
MKQRTVVTGVVVVAVLAVGGLLLRGGPETAAEWRTATVERGDLVVAVSATGAVQPVTQVQVGT